MADQTSAKPYRLVAFGRLEASTHDGLGDTLGSFSAMALEPGVMAGDEPWILRRLRDA